MELDDFSDEGIGMGGHATNLDGLDKDQIMKMMDQEVDGFEYDDNGMDFQVQDGEELDDEGMDDDLELDNFGQDISGQLAGNHHDQVNHMPGNNRVRNMNEDQHDSTIINSSCNTSLE